MPNTTEETQPIYKALVAMRVKCLDGVYRELGKDDPIPPGVFESWPNPYSWAARKFVARIDGVPISPNIARGKYKPPHALTDEDVDRIMRPTTTTTSLFPKAQPGDIGPGKDRPSTVIDPSDYELDQVTPSVPASPDKIAALQAMSRRQLFNLAAQKNIRVNGSDDKDTLVKELSAV
jgi:hypothetical protein